MKWVLLVVTKHLKHDRLSPDVIYESFGHRDSDLVSGEEERKIKSIKLG